MWDYNGGALSCEIAAEDRVVSLAGYAQRSRSYKVDNTSLVYLTNFEKSDIWTDFETIILFPLARWKGGCGQRDTCTC